MVAAVERPGRMSNINRMLPRQHPVSCSRPGRMARAPSRFAEGDRGGWAAGGRIGVALAVHLTRDVHGAEVGPAHRADLRRLEVLPGQALVVHALRGLGIEREREL